MTEKAAKENQQLPPPIKGLIRVIAKSVINNYLAELKQQGAHDYESGTIRAIQHG